MGSMRFILLLLLKLVRSCKARILGVAFTILVIVCECIYRYSKKKIFFARFLTQHDEAMIFDKGMITANLQNQHDPLWSVLIRLNSHCDRGKFVRICINEGILPVSAMNYCGHNADSEPAFIPDWVSATKLSDLFTCFKIFAHRRYLLVWKGEEDSVFDRALGLLDTLKDKEVADYWKKVSSGWQKYLSESHHKTICDNSLVPSWLKGIIPSKYKEFFLIDLRGVNSVTLNDVTTIANYADEKKRRDYSNRINACHSLVKICERNLNMDAMDIVYSAFTGEISGQNDWKLYDVGSFPEYSLVASTAKAVCDNAVHLAEENILLGRVLRDLHSDDLDSDETDDWGLPSNLCSSAMATI